MLSEKEKILYDLVHFIAHDYIELSHDKVMWQRNDWVKRARNAIIDYNTPAKDPSSEEEVIRDPCPECGAELVNQWSGVKCSNKKCGYHFCY